MKVKELLNLMELAQKVKIYDRDFYLLAEGNVEDIEINNDLEVDCFQSLSTNTIFIQCK